jgi:hypothetical protein
MTNSGFVAGTLIHTQTGLKPIEQIQVGDFVLSKPEIGFGEVSYKRVVNTFEYEDKEVWYVEAWMLDSQRKDTPEDRPNHIAMLVVTGNHPLWIINADSFYPREDIDINDVSDPYPSAWLRVDELQEGMVLQAHDCRYAVVKEVKKLIRMGTPGYGWYSDDGEAYPEYGWVVNVNGQRPERCSGVLAGEPELVPLDPNAKPHKCEIALYPNNSIDWQSDGDDIYLTTKVYNLEVEENHTYFVDRMGVWVHDAIQQTS